VKGERPALSKHQARRKVKGRWPRQSEGRCIPRVRSRAGRRLEFFAANTFG